MVLSGPFRPAVVRVNHLLLKWETLGKVPSSYTLQVDGKAVVKHLHGNEYTLNLSHLRPEKYRVTLVANGVHTFFDLSAKKLSERSPVPLAVTSSIDFTYFPRRR